MSKFEDFYSKLMTDTALRSKLAEIIGDRSITEVDDETLEKIGALAKEAGFDITLAEAKEYLSANEIAVSDEELDAVAGGEAPLGKTGPGKTEDYKLCNGVGGAVDRVIRDITS